MLIADETVDCVIIWKREPIRALRAYLGLTQQQLAATLGMRQQTISEWETGRAFPSDASIVRLDDLARTAGFVYADANTTETPQLLATAPLVTPTPA